MFNFNYFVVFHVSLFIPLPFVSVAGHLMELDFDSSYRSWQSVPPSSLFTAPVIKSVHKDKEQLKKQLQAEAVRCDWLILWLDCDREGENIAFEVMEVCRLVKSTMRVMRAHFSSLTPTDINHAINTLTQPNQYLSQAVDARQEIDLRIGSAFTRFQTLLLKAEYPVELDAASALSYGPCQFPTLGFVVERYWKRKNFLIEKWWSISFVYRTAGESGEAKFSWDRGHLFDQMTVILFMIGMSGMIVNVTKASSRDTTKRRPCPLSTVEMQKRLSSNARLSGQRSMKVAEDLYNKGIISYPRTETDQFKEGTNLQALLEIVASGGEGELNQYARSLLNGAFEYPSDGGHDDTAHPPIHPTKWIDNLAGDERKVYEFIVRHFLACCSKDAFGSQTNVQVILGGEKFNASGLMIKARNYLDIYPFDKWYGHTIPLLRVGQQFAAQDLNLVNGETQPPPLLKESDLISLMDANGIGTDATIAEHIQKIQERAYVYVENDHFTPTALGLGLVGGYDSMELSLSSPSLRAHMESEMKEIALGIKSKNQVVERILREISATFDSVVRQASKLTKEMGESLEQNTLGSGFVGRLMAEWKEKSRQHQWGAPAAGGESNESDNRNRYRTGAVSSRGGRGGRMPTSGREGKENQYSNNNNISRSYSANNTNEHTDPQNHSYRKDPGSSFNSAVECYRCHGHGHYASNCTQQVGKK